MTDDEAFIRAVVAAPGDEAPRLVYADWLDERGDPRGAYLRAEVRWARSRHWSASEVTTLANGLDSVWVSRVSRPPMGVCCDGVLFEDGGPPLSLDEVQLIERRVGHQFPSDYRAYLMNVNGGRPDRHVIAQPANHRDLDGTVPPLRVNHFLVAGGGNPGGPESVADLRQAIFNDWPVGYIPVARANETEHLLLGVGDRVWCQVYRWSRLSQTGAPRLPVKVASTFAELLDRLQFPFGTLEGWIGDGDIEPFVQWLDTGGKPDACDRQTGDALLTVAVRYRQPAFVRALLDRRATLPDFIRQEAAASGDPEIVRLIQAAWKQNWAWMLGPRPGNDLTGPGHWPGSGPS